MRVLGIDPGIDTGWAIISEGELTLAGLGSPRDLLPGRECFFHGSVYIECPRIYPTGTPNPNDIVKLAVMVGRYAEYVEARADTVTLISPQTWKGQLPKAVTERRVRARFPDVDKWLVGVPKGKQHNVLDSIGIACYGYDKESRAAQGS